MSKGNVIELLRDDKNYYGELGRKYISSSDIGTLINNPKDFKKHETTLPLLQGSVFHKAILEKDTLGDIEFVSASTRNTKIYKEYMAGSDEEMVLLEKEVDQAKEWATAMTSHMDFYDLIFAEGNEFEVPAVKMIMDRPFKGKADIVSDTVLYDLKTTGDIKDFVWSARKYNYDSQAYIYEQLFGKPLVFLVVCKKTLNLGIFHPTADFIAKGKEKVEKAIENYDKFFGPEATDDVEEYYIVADLY